MARTGMETEVVEGLGEVGDVGLEVAAAQQLARGKVGREAQLLGDRQHERPHARHVLLQRLAGHLDQVAVQLHPHRTLLILPLVHAPARMCQQPLSVQTQLFQLFYIEFLPHPRTLNTNRCSCSLSSCGG